LKSKYLLFFPARRVFRYAGIDVSQQTLTYAILHFSFQKYGKSELSPK